MFVLECLSCTLGLDALFEVYSLIVCAVVHWSKFTFRKADHLSHQIPVDYNSISDIGLQPMLRLFKMFYSRCFGIVASKAGAFDFEGGRKCSDPG